MNNSQLPIESEQVCRSSGKSLRFIGHDRVREILWKMKYPRNLEKNKHTSWKNSSFFRDFFLWEGSRRPHNWIVDECQRAQLDLSPAFASIFVYPRCDDTNIKELFFYNDIANHVHQPFSNDCCRMSRIHANYCHLKHNCIRASHIIKPQPK